jgi:tripartite-type tricarboxylate transporter receptor subunit TctC
MSRVGRRVALGLLLGGASRATLGKAWAESWPTKPVKIVAPFAAGGNVDLTARIVAERLQPLLGQPVIVENKTGAGAMIGAEAVAHAAPDGYTLLLTSAALVLSPALFNRYPYDWQKDFAFITAVQFQPLALTVSAKAPYKTFAEFLELARREPGKLAMGTAGAGSFTHLAGLLLEQRAGVRFEAVHYRGTSAAVADLMGGQISFQFEPISTAIPLIADGRTRALAITSLERSPLLPQVPTIAESGVPGYDAINLLALMAPAGVPAEIIDRLGKAMKQVLEDPTVVKRFVETGAEARYTTPQAIVDIMRTQADTWIPVIKGANLKLE